MEISVIIPVYNSERYLEEALLSVINQTFRDIEIILVNDGSTDGSMSIINRYAAKDERIVIIDKPNQGVAYARAEGVARSRGRYIQTFDNDDYMYPDALERLYSKAIETDADMVVGRSLFYEVEFDKHKMDSRIDFGEITGLQLFSLICNDQACWATWTRLHKASIYRDKEILISPLVNRCEDVYLTPQLCYYAQKVVAIDDTIIKWYIRPASLSNNKKVSDRENEEFTQLPYLVRDFFKSKGLEQQTRVDILKLVIHFHQEKILRGRIKNSYTICKQIMRDIENYPEIERLLAPRMVKILNTFKRYGLLAYLRLWKYRIQNGN